MNRKRLDEVVFPVVARDDTRVDRAVRQAGRVEWRMAPIRLEEVVRRALAATSALFEVGGVALDERIADGLPDVTGDAERLVQVVINLVSNAVKFSPVGRVTVTVDHDAHAVLLVTSEPGSGSTFWFTVPASGARPHPGRACPGAPRQLPSPSGGYRY